MDTKSAEGFKVSVNQERVDKICIDNKGPKWSVTLKKEKRKND